MNAPAPVLDERGVPWVDWGGTGPVVHLAHANGFPPGAYARFVAGLTPHFRVVSMEARPLWPGSDPAALAGWDDLVDDLQAGLASRGLRGILGVGHSLGSVCSLLASARDPGLFRALVLIDPVLFAGARAAVWGFMKRIGRVDATPIVRSALRRRDAWDRREDVRASYAGKPVFRLWAEGTLDDYLDAVLAEDGGRVTLRYPKAWEAQVFRTTPSDAWSQVARVQVPVRVLRGAHSDTFLPSGVRALRRALPEARVIDVPGTGHLLPMERPDEVARLAAGFLAGFP